MTATGRLTGSGRALPALLAAGASLAAFGIVLGLVVAGWPPLMNLNRYAVDVAPPFTTAHPAALWLMRAMSFIGTDAAHAVMLAPVVGWLLWRRLPWPALWSAVVVAVGASLNGVVKLLVAHPRPAPEHRLVSASGYGFPSGHANAAVVTYAVLLAVFLPLLGKGWRVVVTAVAALIVLATGLSRVALGVHYVSDVLGGFALGSTFAALGLAVRPASLTRRQ